MKITEKNWWKFYLGIIFCIGIRLLPFRAPNLEPILGTQMPFTKFFGVWASFLFIFLNIVGYDVITRTLGVWSFFTFGAYAIISVFANLYFRSRESSPVNYLKFAFFSTIFFDLTTGLTVGPILFGQSLMSAFVGQIPFTLLHLAGNLTFAYFLSPIIYKFISKERASVGHPVSVFSLKQI